ncbi:SIMPL domain-containing protein [Priestia megaterium]|uniref:SIMPL domain-containing protein n=1 Tax=Priestia megaterium TaxID=1404 RepID=UPI002E23D372|nr:SIMPL domain-containing protein [Priestia megaterium]MED4287389.1 SIMPL domain-containing protein [Priestia megaterium]
MMEPLGGRAYNHFSYTNSSSRNQNDHTMTIEGKGNVTVKPDQAILTIGVVTENANVETAQQENTVKSNRIIASLRQAGLEQNDIKTTMYSVNPRYNYVEGKSILRGYEVQHSLQTIVKDLSKIGIIYDLAIRNGANQTGNLMFQNIHSDIYYLQALKLAVDNALEKAQQVAKTIGVTLNSVPIKITEENYQTSPVYTQISPVAYGAPAAQALVTPIESGELTFSANLKVVFQYSK